MPNDWVIQTCLGLFWFFLAAVMVSIFLPVSTPVTLAAIAEVPVGFAILALILVGLFDLGALFVIRGWRNRQKAAANAVSPGMSGILTVYLWAQRITAIIAAAVAGVIAAICWLMAALDLTSGDKSLNVAVLLILGLAMASYVIIGLFILSGKGGKTGV